MNANEEADDAPRPLFPPLYWAALGAGLALTLAGAAVGFLGPRVLRPERARPPALTAPGAHGRGAGPSSPPHHR